jgi:hypothetical protein
VRATCSRKERAVAEGAGADAEASGEVLPGRRIREEMKKERLWHGRANRVERIQKLDMEVKPKRFRHRDGPLYRFLLLLLLSFMSTSSAPHLSRAFAGILHRKFSRAILQHLDGFN